MKYTFSFPINPQPKQSVKIGSNKLGHIRAYIPKKKAKYMNDLQLLVASQFGSRKLSGPLIIENVLLVFEMPKSWSEKKKKAYFGTAHIQTPDIDNCLKPLFDSMQKAGVFDDDRQLSSYKNIKKVWGYIGGIEVEIGEL